MLGMVRFFGYIQRSSSAVRYKSPVDVAKNSSLRRGKAQAWA